MEIEMIWNRTETCDLRGMYIAAQVEIDRVTGMPRRRKSYTSYHEHARPEVHLVADRPVGVVMSLVDRQEKFAEYPDQDHASDAPISRHSDTMNKSNRKLTVRLCSAGSEGGGTSTTTSPGTSGTIFLGTTGDSSDSSQGGSFSTLDGPLCSIEKNARP
jgi:hypothetical protein